MKTQTRMFFLLFSVFLIFGCTENMEVRLPEGVTTLMKAADSGDISELKRLISKGAKVNRTSRYGWTALIMASYQGHKDAVGILLDAGADPSIISKEIPSPFGTVVGKPPTTALTQALINGHLSIAHLLVDRGASIDTRSRSRAGKYGDISLLEKLKVRGVDFNQAGPDDRFNTPLIEASEGGNLKNIKWLLKNGVDPNLILQRRTALGEAVKKNQPEVVKYLLNNGADPNLVYQRGTVNPELYGTTAIHDAVLWTPDNTAEQCRKNLKSIKILLSEGADRNYIRPRDDLTILEQLKIRINRRTVDLQDHSLSSDVRERIENGKNCDEAKKKLLQE